MTGDMFEDKIRSIAGILAASGPSHGAQTEVCLVKVKYVYEVAGLMPTGQCKHFVYRGIGFMKPEPAEVILLEGKEPEGAVLSPFDPHTFRFATNDRTVERRCSKLPFKLVPLFYQDCSVKIGTLGDLLLEVVEDVKVR